MLDMRQKRIGSSFSRRDAEIFNAFIHDASLIDLPMGGRRFTWMNKTGSKLSKLDRFLISNSVFLEHSNLQVMVLEKVWSDHNPIFLHCMKFDFGPIPFKIFHSWFDRNDFDDVVKEAWSGLLNANEGPLLSLNGKVKGLKSQFKLWFSQTKATEASRKKSILDSLRVLDEKIDAGMAREEEKILRVNNWYELDNLEKLESKDLFQKARVKSDVEGDEKSKNFHGIINSKRNTQRIHGIMHEGVWIFEPNAIKSAFLNFSKEKFSCHDSLVSFPPMTAAKRLTDSEVTYLDSMVSLEEIKNAVWDCGSQKAPGPDGFSFMFIKKYWDLLHLDIQNFVDTFFSTGTFPPGLHIALKDGLSSNMFRGVNVGSPGIRLSHLFYADDVIIFSDWNQHDMDNIIRILNIFYLASGLRININKSNLYRVGVSHSEVEAMAAGSGCSPSYLPLSYLGQPIGLNMSHISNWKVLIDRFKSRLSAPEAVIKVLESLRASFFWGASVEKKKLAWVKWIIEIGRMPSLPLLVGFYGVLGTMSFLILIL
ncbi:RNA-directed DNA polymerase, eukaryota, reverse transcriptase zinc-binding domain protein [Tanacetum coccineum]